MKRIALTLLLITVSMLHVDISTTKGDCVILKATGKTKSVTLTLQGDALSPSLIKELSLLNNAFCQAINDRCAEQLCATTQKISQIMDYQRLNNELHFSATMYITCYGKGTPIAEHLRSITTFFSTLFSSTKN